jgi:hypothetical protein
MLANSLRFRRAGRLTEHNNAVNNRLEKEQLPCSRRIGGARRYLWQNAECDGERRQALAVEGGWPDPSCEMAGPILENDLQTRAIMVRICQTPFPRLSAHTRCWNDPLLVVGRM